MAAATNSMRVSCSGKTSQVFEKMTWFSRLQRMVYIPNERIRRENSLYSSVDYNYELAILEFDDQGWLYEESQLRKLKAYLAAHQKERFVVVVFVHGWRHNARGFDDNLEHIRGLLRDAAFSETERPPAEGPRKVLGVYLAWRGRTVIVPPLEYLSFFSRKAAAGRVALGAVREVLARLKTFQDLGPVDQQTNEPLTRLIVSGHSFGALILFSAISEYLVETVVKGDMDTRPDSKLLSQFGDVVILINPAFEAARFQPLQNLVSDIDWSGRVGQRSIFIAIGAANDWATRYVFPIARTFDTAFQVPRSWAQRRFMLHTIGNMQQLQTHELTAPSLKGIPARKQNKYSGKTPDARQEDEDFRKFNTEWRPGGILRAGWTRKYSSGVVLSQVQGDPNTPFWIVRATPEVIDGHGGIFGEAFLDFIRQLCDDRLRKISIETEARNSSILMK
jgi:hypothetical protein